MPNAVLHDGTSLPLTISGAGPALLMPIGLEPATGALARQMRAEGLDPQLGLSLLGCLSESFTVVAFHYEDHRLQHPAPGTLTPQRVVADLLAVADAVDVGSFAYFGYSWLGLAGIHLAAETSRVTALVVGGFPPLGAPVEPLYDLAIQAHRAAVRRVQSINPATSPLSFTGSQPSAPPDQEEILLPMRAAQARQFVTFFRHAKDVDDIATLGSIRCPAMCFIGSEDEVAGIDGTISMAAGAVERRAELEAAGWNVAVLDGLNQIEGVQPGIVVEHVLPWLQKQLPASSAEVPIPAMNEGTGRVPLTGS